MKPTWKDWLACLIFALLICFSPFGPDASAQVTDEQIDQAAAKHGADAGLMKRIRKCETPSGGPNAFQVKDFPGRPTDEAGKLDWSAQQVASGNAKKHWVVCTGGRGRGRSAPAIPTVTCVSHTEWQEVAPRDFQWVVVTFKARGSCPYPTPPGNHAEPKSALFFSGCGWHNLERAGGAEPVWGCTKRPLTGKGRL